MKFERNLAVTTRPKRNWGPMPFLRVADDPRPRCVLVVGDGFSRGFLSSNGYAENFPSHIDEHFNLPDSISYEPLPNDRFGPEKSKLWDATKWPLVTSKWTELKPTRGRDFYQAVMLDLVNEDRENKDWTFRTETLNYQLRCYLWHLFHSLDIELRRRIEMQQINWKAWPWSDALWYFLSEFRFSAISFNYDMVLENLISTIALSHGGALPKPFVRCFVEEPELPLDSWPATTVPFYKIHGGIQACLTLDSLISITYHQKPEQCPWMRQLEFEKNAVVGARTTFQPKRVRFPFIPDIVPPGRPGSDIYNPYSEVQRLSGIDLSRADIVVFCGLSAENPDSEEVRQLVNQIPKDSLIYQVGLRAMGDDKNSLAGVLQANHSRCTKFVDASDVVSIIGDLSAKFPPRYEWGRHIAI